MNIIKWLIHLSSFHSSIINFTAALEWGSEMLFVKAVAKSGQDLLTWQWEALVH